MIIVLVYQCMNRTHAYCILYRRFRPWCAHTYWIYRYTAYAEHAHAADACPYLFRLILKLNAWAYMHLYPYVTSLFPAAISHLTQRRPWPTQHGLGPQWKQSQRGMCWFIDLTEFIYSYLPDSGTIHVYEPGTRCLQPTFHFSSTSIKGQPFLAIQTCMGKCFSKDGVATHVWVQVAETVVANVLGSFCILSNIINPNDSKCTWVHSSCKLALENFMLKLAKISRQGTMRLKPGFQVASWNKPFQGDVKRLYALSFA